MPPRAIDGNDNGLGRFHVLLGKQIMKRQCGARKIGDAHTEAGRWLPGQLLKKIWKCFPHAGRIFDAHPTHFQSKSRKTHGHSVIVIRLDGRPVQRARGDLEGIARLNYVRAALGQFGSQRLDALTLLDS